MTALSPLLWPKTVEGEKIHLHVHACSQLGPDEPTRSALGNVQCSNTIAMSTELSSHSDETTVILSRCHGFLPIVEHRSQMLSSVAALSLTESADTKWATPATRARFVKCNCVVAYNLESEPQASWSTLRKDMAKDHMGVWLKTHGPSNSQLADSVWVHRTSYKNGTDARYKKAVIYFTNENGDMLPGMVVHYR